MVGLVELAGRVGLDRTVFTRVQERQDAIVAEGSGQRQRRRYAQAREDEDQSRSEAPTLSFERGLATTVRFDSEHGCVPCCQSINGRFNDSRGSSRQSDGSAQVR